MCFFLFFFFIDCFLSHLRDLFWALFFSSFLATSGRLSVFIVFENLAVFLPFSGRLYLFRQLQAICLFSLFLKIWQYFCFFFRIDGGPVTHPVTKTATREISTYPGAVAGLPRGYPSLFYEQPTLNAIIHRV